MNELNKFKKHIENKIPPNLKTKLDKIETMKDLKNNLVFNNYYENYKKKYKLKKNTNKINLEKNLIELNELKSLDNEIKKDNRDKNSLNIEKENNEITNLDKDLNTLNKDKKIKKSKKRNPYNKKVAKVPKETKHIINEKIELSKAQVKLINNEIVVFTKDKQIYDLLDNRLLGGDSYYISCFINICDLIKNEKIKYSINEIDNRLVTKLNREQIKEVFQIEKYKFEPSKLFKKINETEIKILIENKENEKIYLFESNPFLISSRLSDFTKILKLKDNKDENIYGIESITISIDYFYTEKILKTKIGENYFSFYKNLYEIIHYFLEKENKNNLFPLFKNKMDIDYIYKVFYNLFHRFNNQMDKEKGYFKLDINEIYKFIKDSNFQYTRKQNSIDFHKIKNLKEKLQLNQKENEIIASESIDILLDYLNQAIEIGNNAIEIFYRDKKLSKPKLPKFLPETKIEDGFLIFYYVVKRKELN